MSRSILRQDALPKTRPTPVAIAVAPQSRSITRQLPALNAGAVALVLFALAMLIFTAGCRNPFTVYQHRHTGLDFHGEPDIAYYHYPRGGWFIPSQQTHHCPTMVEAPFHGFQPTCWTQWPEPYCPCPPPSSVQ
ncbi:MAG TPA: hypothetical protein VL096_12615, partial [Pirellulaceae bacterium]|nr:hypothetical protein [Pirellulaceae bacterium]